MAGLLNQEHHNMTIRHFLTTQDYSRSEIDTLLDKIAKSGMSSLTAKEKATLERAREALIRKDQR